MTEPNTAQHRYAVALLAGDGIGQELIAEASRALREVAQLHDFELDEHHLPFGGEALHGYGNRLPEKTREACRRADAVLVAASADPALEQLLGGLDLRWRVQRVLAPDADLVLVSPLDVADEPLAAARAFAIAQRRAGRLAAVGAGERWRDLVAQEAARHPQVTVERLSAEEAAKLLADEPGRLDVIATQHTLVWTLSGTAAYGRGGTRVVASGRLSEGGYGVFAPTHGSAPNIAGLGVANPTGMLLATSLMLGEGLGERDAAASVDHAVAAALGAGPLTADMMREGVAATTREFMDSVLAGLRRPGTDVQSHREVLA